VRELKKGVGVSERKKKYIYIYVWYCNLLLGGDGWTSEAAG